MENRRREKEFEVIRSQNEKGFNWKQLRKTLNTYVGTKIKQGEKERKKRAVICQAVVAGLAKTFNCENLDSVYNGYNNINRSLTS